MTVDRPIIIFGTGRSGTTIFHAMLSEHPRVAWLSEISSRHPTASWRARMLMSGIDNPLLRRALQRRFAPTECYGYWDYHCRGFSTSFRDLVRSDVTERNRRHVTNAMSALTTRRRSRLLLKITGWPKLGFLDEIFGDARFIHVRRDGRAVANSVINVGFWRGWQGPERWRWGPLTGEHAAEWDSHDRSFVALAGIQWKILMAAIYDAMEAVDSSRVQEITYEDLCSDPLGVCRKVVDFCELDWTSGFERSIRRTPLKNTNDKWRQDLTSHQQGILSAVLAETLKHYGYMTETSHE